MYDRFYPHEKREKISVCFGILLFLVFVSSGVVAELSLGKDNYTSLYRSMIILWDYLAYFFPHSLYSVLLGISTSQLIAYLIVAIISYFSFLYIGRYITRHLDRGGGIRVVLGKVIFGYVIVSLASYAISGYLFFRFFFMQPS